MAEYIDVEKLKRNIRVNLMPNVDIDGTVTVENAERYFINLIDKTSTADVAEVVRCKDCIHWWSPMEDDFHYCRLKKGLGGLVVKEDYCSFATRTPKERGADK